MQLVAALTADGYDRVTVVPSSMLMSKEFIIKGDRIFVGLYFCCISMPLGGRANVEISDPGSKFQRVLENIPQGEIIPIRDKLASYETANYDPQTRAEGYRYDETLSKVIDPAVDSPSEKGWCKLPDNFLDGIDRCMVSTRLCSEIGLFVCGSMGYLFCEGTAQVSAGRSGETQGCDAMKLRTKNGNCSRSCYRLPRGGDGDLPMRARC